MGEVEDRPHTPPATGLAAAACWSVKIYPKVVTPAAAAVWIHSRRVAWNDTSPNSADVRLYSLLRPKVSLPVPNGEPKAGISG